jgi:hypothetical protein
MITALIVAALSQAAPTAPTTLAALDVLAEDAEYRFEVTESDANGTNRKIRVYSSRGCTPSTSLELSAPGFPLGLFRISERLDLIAVTWGGATRTVVQVYSVADCRVSKVFDRYVLSVSYVGTDRHGRPTIRATDKFGAQTPEIEKLWRWNGKSFSEIR